MRTVYITKDESTVLKGFFALLILMHHVYQQVLIGEDIAFLDYFFRSLGYIVVSGFFFFSGYGLTLSNQRSKGEYLRGFLRKRFIPLYLVNVFLIVLYTIANIAFTGGGQNLDLKLIAQSFFFGDTIIPAGWYLQELLLFYLIYWLSWKLFPYKYTDIVVLIILIFPVIAIMADMPSHWYLSCAGFSLGVLYASNKAFIDRIIISEYHYRTIVTFLSIIVVTAYVSCYLLDLRFLIYTPLKIYVIAPFIPMVLALLSSRIEFKSRLLYKVGTYALEVYVLQGLVFILLRNNYWNVSAIIFILLSIPLIVIVSYLFHPIFSKVMNMCK